MTPREWLRDIADVLAAVGHAELSERQFRDCEHADAFCQAATSAEILASMLARSAARERRLRLRLLYRDRATIEAEKRQ